MTDLAIQAGVWVQWIAVAFWVLGFACGYWVKR